MYIVVIRTSFRPRSILPWARGRVAGQPEISGKPFLKVEREVAIDDYLPRRLATLQLAGPVTQ